MKNIFHLNKQKKRFILTFIGSLIYINSLIGILGIGQFSVYITSYLHYYNPKVNIQIGNLMMPILLLFLSLSSPLGGYFGHKLGMFPTLIIISLLIEFLIFIFIFQKNIWIIFLIIILTGICIGTVITIPGKNMVSYYPERKGMIMALLHSLLMIFGAIMSVIGEKIINPNKIIIKEGDAFYPLNIAKNYIEFYKLVLVIIPISLIISLLLIKKYNPLNNNNDQTQQLDKNNTNKDENYSKNLKSAIFNNRIWRIAAISIFSQFVVDFSNNTFRVYGALISINGTIMQYSPLIISLSNIILGPIWGYINDKFQNFKIVKNICICFVIHSIILSIFIKSNIIYIICIFVGSIFIAGIHSIIQPHIIKIYGIKYSIEIGGVINISNGIANILIAVISFIISLYYHTGKELQKPYRIIYLVGIGFNFIGYYLASKEKDEPFIYPNSLRSETSSNIDNSINKNISISQMQKTEVKIETNIKN